MNKFILVFSCLIYFYLFGFNVLYTFNYEFKNIKNKEMLQKEFDEKERNEELKKNLFDAIVNGDLQRVDRISSTPGVDVSKIVFDTCEFSRQLKSLTGKDVYMPGYGPIHVAALENRLDIVRYFVENKGVNINSRNKDSKQTAALIAANFGSLAVLQYLISKGVSVDQFNGKSGDLLEENSLLGKACYSEKYEIVRYLICSGATIGGDPNFFISLLRVNRDSSGPENVKSCKNKIAKFISVAKKLDNLDNNGNNFQKKVALILDFMLKNSWKNLDKDFFKDFLNMFFLRSIYIFKKVNIKEISERIELNRSVLKRSIVSGKFYANFCDKLFEEILLNSELINIFIGLIKISFKYSNIDESLSKDLLSKKVDIKNILTFEREYYDFVEQLVAQARLDDEIKYKIIVSLKNKFFERCFFRRIINSVSNKKDAFCDVCINCL